MKKFQYITQKQNWERRSAAPTASRENIRAPKESPVALGKVPPQIPVKFVDVTPKRWYRVKRAEQHNNIGTPAPASFDYDNDGQIDVLLTDDGPEGGLALFHNDRVGNV